jgi:N-acetyl-gamma-glutamyl-phosphate reductase/acetylglutamate kinase
LKIAHVGAICHNVDFTHPSRPTPSQADTVTYNVSFGGILSALTMLSRTPAKSSLLRLPAVSKTVVHRTLRTAAATSEVAARKDSTSTSPLFSFDVRQLATELRSRKLTTSSQGAAQVAGGMDRDTIIRLLYSLGSRHEVERYLRIFTNTAGVAGDAKHGGVLPEAKFAVLK